MGFKKKQVSEWRRAVLEMGGTENERPEDENEPRRMRARSKRTAKLYAEERVPLLADIIGGPCVAGAKITRWIKDGGRVLEPNEDGTQHLAAPAYGGCSRIAAHGHELLPRSRGGSITDRDNVIGVCWECHRFIHKWPQVSKPLGLLR